MQVDRTEGLRTGVIDARDRLPDGSSEKSPVAQVGKNALYTGETAQSITYPEVSIDTASKSVPQTGAISHRFAHTVTGQSSVAVFKPSRLGCDKELNPFEAFFCPVYVKESFVFRGKINVDRFLAALEGTLDTFPFLYDTIQVDGAKLSRRLTEESRVSLEIQTQAGSIRSATTTSTLPDKIDERMKQSFVGNLQGLPMVCFKLTQFDDGFAIGFYMNHGLMDQSSIVYFFQELSQRYNGGSSVKAPVLFDMEKETRSVSNPLTANSVEEFHRMGQEIGYINIPDKRVLAAAMTRPDPRIVVELRFSTQALQEYKKSLDSDISSNDLVHAVLLKIQAENKAFLPENEHTLNFACNMRSRMDLGEEVIGNVLHGGSLKGMSTEFLRNATIQELARKNRECVGKLEKEQYLQKCTWFDNFKKFGGKPSDFLPEFIIKPFQLFTSNWVTFPYDKITFDKQEPVKVTTIALPRNGLCIISFDSIDVEKVLTISLAIPRESLAYAKQLASDTVLFTFQEIVGS